ncbi:hypothetical protein AVEN_45900-1 [Araneus ventricosus]|uniref:Uncharacterized protein n=1 Tax=Araneus ventricosus TaxID=182803 RepID=A0A4Y2E8N3_ARAVE|nr:hypothetical protein AVEN_45900-1 [Araneus ventricosus]
MIGAETDAINKGHRNTLLKFKSWVKSLLPYTLMGDVFAADSCCMLFPRFFSVIDSGRTLTSDLISIRNKILDLVLNKQAMRNMMLREGGRIHSSLDWFFE